MNSRPSASSRGGAPGGRSPHGALKRTSTPVGRCRSSTTSAPLSGSTVTRRRSFSSVIARQPETVVMPDPKGGSGRKARRKDKKGSDLLVWPDCRRHRKGGSDRRADPSCRGLPPLEGVPVGCEAAVHRQVDARGRGR